MRTDSTDFLSAREMGQEFEVGRHGVTFACGPNMTDFVHPLFVGRV